MAIDLSAPLDKQVVSSIRGVLGLLQRNKKVDGVDLGRVILYLTNQLNGAVNRLENAAGDDEKKKIFDAMESARNLGCDIVHGRYDGRYYRLGPTLSFGLDFLRIYVAEVAKLDNAVTTYERMTRNYLHPGAAKPDATTNHKNHNSPPPPKKPITEQTNTGQVPHEMRYHTIDDLVGSLKSGAETSPNTRYVIGSEIEEAYLRVLSDRTIRVYYDIEENIAQINEQKASDYLAASNFKEPRDINELKSKRTKEAWRVRITKDDICLVENKESAKKAHRRIEVVYSSEELSNPDILKDYFLQGKHILDVFKGRANGAYAPGVETTTSHQAK